MKPLHCLSISVIVLTSVLPCHFARAQFGEEETKGPRLGKETTQYLQIGMIVSAVGGPCRGIVGTVPIPIDWPEQQVRVVEEDFSPRVGRVRYRMLGGSVQQMVVEIPYIPAGEQVRAVTTLEIVRHTLLAPEETDVLLIPDKLDRKLRPLLAPSPYIESRNKKIRSLVKEILADRQDASDWEKVAAIYDWVRDNVVYKNGPLKGALRALRDGEGDCEELTSLFIALCRAGKIPARTVWVPGHCYPEFYLQDDEGQGYWFPCQAAGTRAFGGIPETRAILQKGDNFRDPDRPRKRLRYVSEFLIGKGGSPKVKFIRQAVDAP